MLPAVAVSPVLSPVLVHFTWGRRDRAAANSLGRAILSLIPLFPLKELGVLHMYLINYLRQYYYLSVTFVT
jgi:hypothetical protein